MPIRVECEACGAKYRVDDRRAGTEIPCKECDADIWVPEPPRRGGPARGPRGAGRREQELSRRRDDFDYEEPAEDGGFSSNPAMFVVCLAAGGLVLAGIVFGVMFALKDDPAPPNQVAQNDPEEKPLVEPDPIPQPNPNRFNAAPRPEPVNPNPELKPDPFNREPKPDPFNREPKPDPFHREPEPINPQPVPGPVNPPVVNNNPERENPMPRGFLPPDENLPALPPDLTGKWDVKFDALPEPISFENERKLRVPLPTGVKLQDVLWPASPSYFVGLGSNGSDREVREVFDIRTRKKVGRIGGFRAWGGKSALSPDGKFFAISNRDSKGVFVWDVEGSKSKDTLPLPSSSGATVLNFAGPKRLVAAADAKSPLQVWSLPDGNPERTIAMPEEYVAESVTFSPGGKYAAVFNKKSGEPTIQVFDLDTGEFAGAARVPQKGDNDFWVPTCHALMFSTDGEEIAGIFEETFKGKYFYVFNLKDGQQTFEYTFEDDRDNWWPDANSTPIQWFPHKKRWLLFGNLLLDRAVGKIVWKFSTDKNAAAGRRILNDQMMMGVNLENNKLTLLSFPVEEDKIAKVAETVESGGTLVDAKLPPLTAIDRTAVRQLALDVAAGNWSGQPDPAPAGESPLKNNVTVSATAGRMTGLFLSNPEAGLAVVYSELKGPGILPPRGAAASSAFSHADVYNVRTGRRSDQMDFNFSTKMAAFSPSGNRIASVYQPDADRLDIWSAKDGKPALALRPYNDEDKNHRKIEAVAFVDDDHLLTLNNQKKLVLWKLPECKAVYEIAEAMQPGLSPNQKYLAVSTGNGYLLLDSRTGNQIGGFNIEGTMHAAAFHPDGTRFAASCTGPKGPTIVVWSLEDGGALTEFPIQGTAKNMHWCDGDHLLMNNESLVDVAHKLIVWKYRLGAGAHAPQSPDGRHWYITSKGASGAELIAAKLPEPKVTEFLATQTLKPDFLLQPGGKLSVQINLPDSGPGQTDIRKRALENLITKYQDQGTSVGGGSDLVVAMDLKENSTGENQELRITESSTPFGGFFPTGGGEMITIPVKTIECKMTYTYQGKLLNEQKATFSNRVGGFFGESLPKGKSPEQHLTEKMWNMASGYFTNYGPPVYVFRDFEGKGFGLSTLSDQGPLPQGVGG